MIVYGGTFEQISQQQICDHEWSGPYSDSIDRYNKCTKCFCLEYDCSEEAYLARMKVAIHGEI